MLAEFVRTAVNLGEEEQHHLFILNKDAILGAGTGIVIVVNRHDFRAYMKLVRTVGPRDLEWDLITARGTKITRLTELEALCGPFVDNFKIEVPFR